MGIALPSTWIRHLLKRLALDGAMSEQKWGGSGRSRTDRGIVVLTRFPHAFWRRLKDGFWGYATFGHYRQVVAMLLRQELIS